MVGLLLAIVLVARRSRAAILISILVTTVFAVILNAIVDVSAQIAPGNPQTQGLEPERAVGARPGRARLPCCG